DDDLDVARVVVVLGYPDPVLIGDGLTGYVGHEIFCHVGNGLATPTQNTARLMGPCERGGMTIQAHRVFAGARLADLVGL
ncbi:MAG: hypothetical protein HOL85_20735, partial [Rhodospirillaceae bacterium]|nr:hypothetical protein [Rhodospirillaceae bacterium]